MPPGDGGGCCMTLLMIFAGGSPTAAPALKLLLLPRLKDGGTISAGKVIGRFWPDLAMSTRCMATTNSSEVSLPSLSMSDNVLKGIEVETSKYDALLGNKLCYI